MGPGILSLPTHLVLPLPLPSLDCGIHGTPTHPRQSGFYSMGVLSEHKLCPLCCLPVTRWVVLQLVGLGLVCLALLPLPRPCLFPQKAAHPASSSSPWTLLFLAKPMLVTFQLPWFLGNQIFLSLGPRLSFPTALIIGLCPQPTSDLYSGIIPGFNPFMAKSFTIPYHTVSTFKGSTSPLAFLSSKCLAVWFSNYVFQSHNVVQTS